jgi:hypothetical protein
MPVTLSRRKVMTAGAWIVAGVLLAAIGWLVLGGDTDATPDAAGVDA